MFSSARQFFTGLFFIPDAFILGNPSDYGVAYEDIRFPSSGGHTLHGIFMTPSIASKGTVIHCHGNAGNLTNHFQSAVFLVHAGYNVFTFDYSGYGQSEGTPSPLRIIDDTLDAVRFVKTRKEVDSDRLILFGQSLGGAAAAAAMARDSSIRCLILEATFTTYRDMAFNTALGRMLFFLTPFVIPDIGPLRDLDAIAPRPVLFVHGKDDSLIPHKFSETLYRRAKGKKVLRLIDGLQHLHTDTAEEEYQRAVLDFLSATLPL